MMAPTPRLRAPRSLAHGGITFADRGCCVRVTCDAARETHAVRLCANEDDDDDAHARDDMKRRDDALMRPMDDDDGADETTASRTVRKHFAFGLTSPIENEEVVVRVDAEDGCVVVGRSDEPTRSGTRRRARSGTFETRQNATSDAFAVSGLDDVTIQTMTSSSSSSSSSSSGGALRETTIVVVVIAALALFNFGLRAWRRRKNRPSQSDVTRGNLETIDWRELVGEKNVNLVQQLIREQEERRVELAPTAEWTIRATAPAVDYAAPMANTGDLLWDFLCAVPESIAVTYVDDDSWSETDDDDDVPLGFRLFRGNSGAMDDSDESTDDMEHRDVFGNRIKPGKDFQMCIHGHGPPSVAKRVLKDVASMKYFMNCQLNFFSDMNEE